MNNNTETLISIIIPVFNEEKNVIPLARAIAETCATTLHETIFIDDGSTDETRKKLQGIQKEIPNLIVLPLKKNFGQTPAMAAGIHHAKGSIIIAMDGDGQNDPKDIPSLIKKINEGFDVVSGWRENRKDPFISRQLPSRLANFIISWVTGVHLHDYGCTLKAYRKGIIKDLQIAGEMHRFLPAWCAWQGGKVAEIPVEHHPRIFGKSKYGLIRIFKVLIDLLTLKFFSGYLTKPNYLFSGIGFITFAIGCLAGLLAIYDKFGPDLYPKFRIPLMLMSVFMGLISVFLVLMGVLAELLVRLYFQAGNLKPYRLADE